MLEGVNNADFKVNQMLEMQDELNKKVHPDWKNQDYPWYRAAVIEASEMIDHLGWKWWKHQEPDIEQAKLELVDIWHFCLSDYMSEGRNIITSVCRNDHKNMSHYEQVTLIEYIEAFQQYSLEGDRCEADYIPVLLDKLGMDFNELYKLYVSKNVLNMFRQENGYKSGSYLKDWNGKEDNVVLMEIVNSLDVDSETFKDDILKGLQKEYKFACALDDIRRINND